MPDVANKNGLRLGALRETFVPSTQSLWFYPLLLTGPLLLLLISAAVTIGDVYSGRGWHEISNSVGCIGLVVLLMAVVGAVWLSEFRAWRASRTVELSVYENGFTWSEAHRTDLFLWDEIEKLRYRKILIVSKALRRWVEVIKTIHLKDGRTIKLPETLTLEPITALFHEAWQRPDPPQSKSRL